MTGTWKQTAICGCYGAVLFTLPWIGLGSVRLLTGVDTGAGFQPSYLLLALACLVAAVSARSEQLWAVLRAERTWLALWILSLAAILISGLGILSRPAEGAPSLQWARFAKQLFQYLVMVCFAVFPWIWTRHARRWNLTTLFLATGVGFQVLYAIAQAVNFYVPMSWFATAERVFTSNPAILAGSEELYLDGAFRGIPRLRGTACEPLYLGNYLLLAIPFLLLRRKWAGWLFAALGLGLLLMTWARGAYVSAVAALIVGLVLLRRSGYRWRRRAWLLPLAMSAVAVATAVVLVWGPDKLLLPWQRLLQSFSQHDWSNLTRLYSMQAGWRAFTMSPVWGIGWGQYAFHFPSLVDPMGLQSQFSWPVVNNYPLQILCETGLTGFVLFGIAVLLLARRVWLAASSRTALGRRLGIDGRLRVVAAATAVVGVWFQLLTFSQYNLPHIWVALGLLLAALRPDDATNGQTGRPAAVCFENEG